MQAVRVHPAFDPTYDSYFLHGLIDTFGFSALSFTDQGFPAVDPVTAYQTGSPLHFVTPEGTRVVCDSSDNLTVAPEALVWCDVYAKTNFAPDAFGASGPDTRKVIPCFPYFPVRLPTFRQNVSVFLRTLACRRRSPIHHLKAHIYRIYRFRFTLPVILNTATETRDDYVIHHSSLRKDDPAPNRLYAAFMEACIDEPSLTFEGGFLPRHDGLRLPQFDHLLLPEAKSYPLSPKQYLARQKASLVLFNTPAVEGNLSWRLAEGLALGKAIISTNDIRPLNVPLTHGENVHFVDPTPEAIADAVTLLRKDPTYRRALESGARAYFAHYGAPSRLVTRIIRQPAEP